MVKNKIYIHKSIILFITFILIITVPSVFSLTIEDTVQNFENTINLYNNNEISVAQLIVLLEDYMDENQRYLQENDLQGWNKQEIKNALRKYQTEYGYVIDAHDLHIFIGLYEPTSGYYGFGYSISGRKYSKSHFDNQWGRDIENFKNQMLIKYKNDDYDFSDLIQNWHDVTLPAFHVTYQECLNYMSNFMDEISNKNLPNHLSDIVYYPETSNERLFFTTIYEETQSECMNECQSQEWIEDEMCNEICASYRAKFGLLGHCSESEPFNFIGLGRVGFGMSRTQLEYMQNADSFFMSQPHMKECEPYHYEGTLYLRKKLQESLNNNFFDWYVNDFLGNDFEKYKDPGSGIKRIMGFFELTAKIVSETLECKGENSWPNEFQKININYKNGDYEFIIWEELESERRFNVDMWSTYYRYNIVPNKNIMKELINRQLSEQSSFGPPQQEIEKIKSQKEAMDLIDKVIKGFGDSMDFEVILKDKDEIIANRYISINKDVIIKISEQTSNDIDFKAIIEFDDLYDFLKRLSYIDFQQIRGPGWSTKRSPLMIGERIGLIFDFWSAFSIEPWRTKARLTTRIKTVVSFLQEMNDASPNREQTIEELNEQMDQEIRRQDVEIIDEKPDVSIEQKGDSIIFKLEMTHPGGTSISEYKAINLKSDYPDFKLTGLEGDDSISIILGSQQTGWTFYYGEWMDMTRMQSWDNLWESYYGTFEFAYSTILRENKDEIVLNPEPGVTMRIYDIQMNPQISASEFSPN